MGLADFPIRKARSKKNFNVVVGDNRRHVRRLFLNILFGKDQVKAVNYSYNRYLESTT